MRLYEPPPAPFTGYPRRGSVTVTCGPPASGKTTWTCRRIARDPHHRQARVNRDLLRELHGCLPVGDQVQEDIITVGSTALVEAYLNAGLDVYIDDTCSSPRTLRGWLSIADRFQVPLTVVDFTVVPVEVCVERDNRRGTAGGRRCGPDVIRVLAERCAKTLRDVPVGVSVVRPFLGEASAGD